MVCRPCHYLLDLEAVRGNLWGGDNQTFIPIEEATEEMSSDIKLLYKSVRRAERNKRNPEIRKTIWKYRNKNRDYLFGD